MDRESTNKHNEIEISDELYKKIRKLQDEIAPDADENDFFTFLIAFLLALNKDMEE